MNVTHKLTADLLFKGVAEPIHAVQCDANTRAVAVTLTAGGVAWEPPAGTAVSVAFKKPDGKKGWYDKLPDKSPACSVSGNVVTAILAPEALTAAGKVDAVIVFQDKNLNQLATFGFAILVEPNPAAGRGISNDYYAYSTMEAVSEAVDAMLDSLEDTKADIGQMIVQVSEAVSRAEQAAGPAIVNQASGDVIAVSDSSDRLVHGLRVFGKTVQNDTPSPNAPVELESAGANGSIGVKVLGKNLIPFPYITKDKTQNGITFAVLNDGGIKVSGTATDATYFNLCNIHFADIFLYAHGSNYTDGNVSLSGSKEEGYVCYSPNNNNTYIQVNAGSTVNAVIYPQMEYGTAQTAYERYKPIQTITASTPNGLPGIPVTSGGNYTDENGQQWICDEVDFARGVYVQRVRQLSLAFVNMNNSEEYPGWKLQGENNVLYADLGQCNTAFHSITPCLNNISSGWTGAVPYVNSLNGAVFFNPAAFGGMKQTEVKAAYADATFTLFYAMKNRTIETPLSAEELAAYAALHTNKPNTTVHNDGGAHMELSYVADTKLYIDNKFTELAAAIVSNA